MENHVLSYQLQLLFLQYMELYYVQEFRLQSYY